MIIIRGVHAPIWLPRLTSIALLELLNWAIDGEWGRNRRWVWFSDFAQCNYWPWIRDSNNIDQLMIYIYIYIYYSWSSYLFLSISFISIFLTFLDDQIYSSPSFPQWVVVDYQVQWSCYNFQFIFAYRVTTHVDWSSLSQFEQIMLLFDRSIVYFNVLLVRWSKHYEIFRLICLFCVLCDYGFQSFWYVAMGYWDLISFVFVDFDLVL